MSQFTFVFNGTLAQNISLNFETIAEVELQAIEKIAENVGLNTGHADNLTLSSILGAGGIELSGGQKRRLGIARALYKNCKVLVLDEVSTGLDIASEAEITGLITSLANRGLIIFVISHSERLRSLCTAKIALLKQ